jgi:tryptophanyl-tRNA synthetase
VPAVARARHRASERFAVARHQQGNAQPGACSPARSRAYRPGTLREPQAVVARAGGVLRGLDGRKMSKSYGNTIPLFAPPEQQAKLIRRVVTDSRGPQDPKDLDTSCTRPCA